MPIVYEICDECEVIGFVFSGLVTIDQQVDAFLACMQDSSFRPDMQILIDLKDSTFLDARFKDVVQLTYRMRPWYEKRSENGQTAIIAREDVQFGVSRMYQMHVDTRTKTQIEVFRTPDEAMRYLGFDANADILTHLNNWQAASA